MMLRTLIKARGKLEGQSTAGHILPPSVYASNDYSPVTIDTYTNKHNYI